MGPGIATRPLPLGKDAQRGVFHPLFLAGPFSVLHSVRIQLLQALSPCVYLLAYYRRPPTKMLPFSA